MTSHHMDWESFRQAGYRLIDELVDYHTTIEDRPVLSRNKPGDVRAALPAAAPVKGEPFETILEDVRSIIYPGLTNWQSPGFFAYFPANTSGPSILGELLSAGLGVQGMLWQTSPACTELETHVLDWLVDLLGLPAPFRSDGTGGGVIQDSASSACLCALIAARHRVTQDTGVEVKKLVAYCSEHAHSSVEKSARIAGIPRDNLRTIGTNDVYALDAAELAQQIQADKAAGLVPFFVCATIGSTSSHAIDPVAAIARISRKHALWVHVDAAMIGTAAICPEYRYIHDGLSEVDSYCFNPHKWMFTNFDCDCFYVSDRSALVNALSILPEYLRNPASEEGSVIDYRDWQVPLGRRFRALKLWFVIRHYGVEGLQFHVREHIRIAHIFAKEIERHPDFEVCAPYPFNLVCFRHLAGDEANRSIEDMIARNGHFYLTHTVLDGDYVLRLSVGQTHTEER
ncbi:MAG: pyridoxal-dependent decarboxylase, partial [Spirochaetota bacterium]